MLVAGVGRAAALHGGALQHRAERLVGRLPQSALRPAELRQQRRVRQIAQGEREVLRRVARVRLQRGQPRVRRLLT